jgi:hypothetical protein
MAGQAVGLEKDLGFIERVLFSGRLGEETAGAKEEV